MLRRLSRELHLGALLAGLVASLLVGISIYFGSRRLNDFDSALVGYAFACLFMVFGIVYRYGVWLSKPPTRLYWVRGWQLFFTPAYWRGLRMGRMLSGAVLSRIVIQDFVLRRGVGRWVGHMLIAWGCILAAMVTFPLVFGWLHFETGQVGLHPTFRIMMFGFPVGVMPLHGVIPWLFYHMLVVAAFMVIPGVMLAMFRRMKDPGAIAVQRFSRDLLPLALLLAVSVSGLMLWVSYEWLDAYFYSVCAQFHAICVIAGLVYLPFGKLFHIFQRPASLGVALYRTIGAEGEQTECALTGERFAPKMQTDDLKVILPQLGFDYRADDPASPNWSELSPQARRMLIGRAHSRIRDGKFD